MNEKTICILIFMGVFIFHFTKVVPNRKQIRECIIQLQKKINELDNKNN